jgi:thiamine kinase-like enzyme
MLKEMMSKPWTFSRYSRMLAQCHINIQKPIDIELPTVKEKLKRDIEGPLLSNIEKQRIYQYIYSLSDGNILCHFDFHPDNIMLSRCGRCQ